VLYPRVIPCLLIKENRLVKSVQFDNYHYLGDPINATKIFNDKSVDEIIILDITSSKQNNINTHISRDPNRLRHIKKLAYECLMPLTYGGGIRSVEDIDKILKIGVEKVVLNSIAIQEPSLIRTASRKFGSQSIIISIDAKKINGEYEVYTSGANSPAGIDPMSLAIQMEGLGAGEIFLNSIDRDGTKSGYDIELIKSVSQSVSIPVIACGGAGTLDDLYNAICHGGASAVSAGSLFVFHGRKHAVLISFPTAGDLESTFRNSKNQSKQQ